jgi:hypothetical protein
MLFVKLTVEKDTNTRGGMHFRITQWLVIRTHQVCFELAAHRQYAAISEHVCTCMHCSYLVDASLRTACIVKVSIKCVI